MQQRQLNRTSNSLGRQHVDRSSIDAFNWESDDFRIPWSSLDILIVGAFANWASGAAMHRKITRQSRWNLRRASDKAIPNQAPEIGGRRRDWMASTPRSDSCAEPNKRWVSSINFVNAAGLRPQYSSFVGLSNFPSFDRGHAGKERTHTSFGFF